MDNGAREKYADTRCNDAFWREGPFMEIVPKVHRVPNVNGSNAVLLEGETLALVDTGIPGNGDAIVSYIESIGRKPTELTHIILSHYHHDHSGSANELAERTGAQIVAH